MYLTGNPNPGVAHLDGSVRVECDVRNVVGRKRGCDAAHHQRRAWRPPVADLLAVRRELLHAGGLAWLKQLLNIYLFETFPEHNTHLISLLPR